MRSRLLFLCFFVVSCTGNQSNMAKNTALERPSGGGEGVPGYILTPNKVKSKYQDANLIVEAPAGVVVAKNRPMSDLKVSVWNTSSEALAALASSHLEKAALSEGTALGSFQPQADGSFHGEIVSPEVSFDSLVVFVTVDTSSNLLPISSSPAETTTTFSSIPAPMGETSFAPLAEVSPTPPVTTFHTVFVTSSRKSGSFGGLTGADTICRGLALGSNKTKNLAGVWRAILSTNMINAKDRISLTPGAAIKNTAGQIVVSDASQLWSGALQNAIGYTENSILINPSMTSNPQVWTGTQANGTAVVEGTALTCTNWASSNSEGRVGNPLAIDGTWLEHTESDCQTHSGSGSGGRFYCINSDN